MYKLSPFFSPPLEMELAIRTLQAYFPKNTMNFTMNQPTSLLDDEQAHEQVRGRAHEQARGRALATPLLLLGALLGALGWWLPWVWHQNGSAALVLLGLDLIDFWKFTNEWRLQDLFWLERLCFVLPPPLAAMTLALSIAGWREPKRWLLLPLLLFLSLVVLPAYEDVRRIFEGNPFIYDDPNRAREFTFQLYFALSSLLVVALIPLWQRLNHRLRRLLIALIALIAATLPSWALWRTWLVLQGFYGDGAVVGVGIVVSSVGFLLVVVGAIWERARGSGGEGGTSHKAFDHESDGVGESLTTNLTE